MAVRSPDSFTHMQTDNNYSLSQLIITTIPVLQGSIEGCQNFATHLSYVIGNETHLTPPFDQGGSVVGELVNIEGRLGPPPGP